MTGDYDWLFYSKGTYWLFEHWQEDGKNIYGKAKYDDKAHFLKGAGKHLNQDQINQLENGKNILLKQPDGTTFFFKYVNFD